MNAAEDFPGFCRTDFLLFPACLHRGVERTAITGLWAEVSAACFRCGDPLSLTLTDKGAFGFGDVGQQLEDYIRDEGAGEVSRIPCVQ